MAETEPQTQPEETQQQQEQQQEEQDTAPFTTNEAFGEMVQDPEEGDDNQDEIPVEAHVNEMMEKELPLKFCLDHLSTARKSKQLYRDLCIYIPFVIWFVFFSYYRRDTFDGHYMSSAFSDALVYREVPPTLYHVNATKNAGPHFLKVFADLDNPADWHNWFEGVVIPLFYDPLNRGALNSKWAPLSGNLKVGSLRVRSHRTLPNSCADLETSFYPANYSQNCWAAFCEDCSPNVMSKVNISFKTNPNVTFPYTDGCKYRGQAVAGWINRYPCGGYIVDFPVNMSFDQALAQARLLRQEGYVSHEATRFLAVEFFTYNPNLDMFMSGRMFHEVTAGGGWIPTNRFKSFTVFTDEKFPDGILAMEFLFFIFVLYYFVRFFIRWGRSIKKTKRCMLFFFTFWNFLEFCNLVLFFTSFALHWEWWRRSTKDLKIKLPDNNLEWSEPLNYLNEVYYLEQYILAINTVITFLMIMKYFEMNPRLNILTRTLEASAQSVVGVVIIFILIVLCYAIAGMLLYGANIYDFRNLSSAFSNLFLTLLGEFDYGSLRIENRGWTFVYFWTYTVLSLFILLNFITAIIGNGFDEEQAKSKPLPLNVQLRRLAITMKRFSLGERCKLYFDALVKRTRRLPEDILEDHLGELRFTLLLGEKINPEAVDDGDVDEPEFLIARQTLNDILPTDDLDLIGEETLNDLFVEWAEDYDISVDEAEGEEAHIEASYETAMQEGFINVFVNNRSAIAKTQGEMLGGGAAEDTGKVVLNGKTLSFRRMSRRGSTSSMGSATSNKSNEEAATQLNTFDVLNKLLGEASEDEKAKKKRRVVEELIDKQLPGGVNSNGIAVLQSRVSRVESAVDGLNSMMNLVAHKLTAAVDKKKKK